MKNFAFAFITVSLIALALFLPDKDAENQQAQYCEMVKIYRETKGRYGWPDYRGNAKRVCKDLHAREVSQK